MNSDIIRGLTGQILTKGTHKLSGFSTHRISDSNSAKSDIGLQGFSPDPQQSGTHAGEAVVSETRSHLCSFSNHPEDRLASVSTMEKL